MHDLVTTVAVLAVLCAVYRRQCLRVRYINEIRRDRTLILDDLPRTIAVS